METITEYISIYFVLALIFGNDFLNKFIPFYKKINNRFTILILASVLAFLFHFLNFEDSKQKLAISFLFAVTSYDFIVKPFKLLIEKKVGQFTEK